MNEKPGSRPGFLRNVWGVGQSRHLAMCRSLPIYPQLRKWHCTAITDATCQQRKWSFEKMRAKPGAPCVAIAYVT